MNVRVGFPVLIDLPECAAEYQGSLCETSGTAAQDPFATLVKLRSILTEHAAIAAQEATAKNRSALSELVVIGVTDPGKITVLDEGPRGHVDLIDSPHLADLSGVNVVSGFPARDLATGGRGSPLSPLPLWVLFRSAHCDRIFVHIGRVVWIVRLPRLTGSLASVSGLAFRQSHGTALMDLLVSQLTSGRRQFDAGGRMAVQGRRVDELVKYWLDRSESFDLPTEADAPEMLRSAVGMAVEKGWSVYDMLCSATHFVADSASRAAKQLIRESSPTELILSGGGLLNGLLLRHFAARLSEFPLRRIEDLGGRPNIVAPTVAAVLALLHLDQVPANVAGLTGAETPRVLGTLNPGGTQAWQRLLESCASRGRSIRPLRAAL